MNQEHKLGHMRVYYQEGEIGVLGDVAYRRELEMLEKTVSGIDKGNVTNDEVLRRLTK